MGELHADVRYSLVFIRIKAEGQRPAKQKKRAQDESLPAATARRRAL